MEPFSALAEELLGMYYKLKQGSFSMKDNQCNAKLPFITSVHRGTKKENMIPRQSGYHRTLKIFKAASNYAR